MLKHALTALLTLALLCMPSAAHAQLGSVPTTFTPGSVIRSADVNAMFSAIYANAANRIAPVFTGAATTLSLFPTADNTSDLGSAALSYKDAWIQGTLTVGTVSAGAISGTLSLTSQLTITVTSAQLRLAYDGSNYIDATVGSTGLLTLDATGAGAGVAFADIAAFTLGLKERSRTVALGEWANQTYAAGDYTASAGTWTVDSGDVTLNRFSLVGKTLTWQVVIVSTDVSATPANLRIALPGSQTASAHSRGGACGATTDNGTGVEPAYWTFTSGDAFVQIHNALAANSWSTTAADNTAITCTITLEIA